MKVNRYGRAKILTTDEINLLFNEGFTKPRDRALFGVCLYAAYDPLIQESYLISLEILTMKK